jgi:hypothetical protein
MIFSIPNPNASKYIIGFGLLPIILNGLLVGVVAAAAASPK